MKYLSLKRNHKNAWNGSWDILLNEIKDFGTTRLILKDWFMSADRKSFIFPLIRFTILLLEASLTPPAILSTMNAPIYHLSCLSFN